MKPSILKFLLLLTFLCIGNSLSAQDTLNRKPKKPFWDKIYIGGNFGLQIGTVTFIDVSPLVGYKITDKLSAGIGGTYQYYRYKNNFYDFSTNVYGGRIFGRYNITENLFAHAEYEVLNLEAFDINTRVNVTSVLIGGGYRQSIGANSYLNILALWNINESVYSPYANPIIRVGVNFGL